LISIIVLVLACFTLASVAALYSYGRFAARAQGEPASALPVSETGCPLDLAIAPLLQERPGQSGLVMLDGNLEAFAIRALTARQAERSLDLQYYIWKDDLTGRLLINEVINAADRGVRVRLLLDDNNAQGFDRTWSALDSHPRIEVRLFNPSRNRENVLRRGLEMLLRAVSVTRRMHNKAWIADGRLAVVGGRNIGDAYFDAATTANFRDLDLILLGAAVGQTETVFDSFWNCRAALPVTALRPARENDPPNLRSALAMLSAEEATRPYLDRVAQDEDVRRLLSGKGHIHWTRDARVLSDPPGKALGRGEDNWLMNAVRPQLLSARSDLEIISPYFIPGEAGTDLLAELRDRGVRVAVLTNSLAATDVTAVHGAYARYRKPLLAAGIHLFELKPYDHESRTSLFGSSGASLHTKAFSVDDRIGFIGSMNFDPRSITLNTEMGVFFEHDELVRELRRIFADETSPPRSYSVGVGDAGIIWVDAALDPPDTWVREPEASLWRRLAATIIGLLPIESQL
jgi:cardiolipin synthase C